MASYVPILFALLALLAQANAHVKPSVSIEVCEKSLFKSLCVSTFASLPQAKSGNVFDLATIALTTVTREAVAIHAHIALLAKTNVNVGIKVGLSDCAKNYQSAVESLKESAVALKGKNFSDVNTLVSAAMSEAGSCEDGIKGKSLILSPLNKKFNDLCSILLTFANQCAAPKLGLILH